jgi:hypothetical protein
MSWRWGSGTASRQSRGCETTIDDGAATVGPVSSTTAMGTASMTFRLAKEEAGWMIVGTEMQQ